MEKKEWIDGCRRLFTRLLRAAVWPDFQFPSGGKADRQLSACFDLLCREAGSVSPERLSDFCICQVYALSGYAPSYRGKWNISHSFGRKAADRYLHSGKERRYWEDRWLKGFGLSRDSLTQAVENRRGHPFGRFIYPEYEEIYQTASALQRGRLSRLCALHIDVDTLLAVMFQMYESGSVPP